MNIILAEMGLVAYKGKIQRTKNIFKNPGTKEKRKKYLINRLAFLRAYFKLLQINEVVLYRSMATESDWRNLPRTFLSCTFNLRVAKSFSDLKRKSKFKNSYITKMTVPVKQIFMTYLETEAMNQHYKEAEAIILCNKKFNL